VQTGRRRSLVSGLLTEACVSFPVLSATRAIVEAQGGGYGIGLAYARDMVRPE